MKILDIFYDIERRKKIITFLFFRFEVETSFNKAQKKYFKNKKKLNRLYEEVSTRFNITKLKPAEEGSELRKIQTESLKILKKINKICTENELTYWIDFGTLIGAVRTASFIPWDNDIDISMPRADFEKIDKLLKTEFLNTKYKVRVAGFSNHFQIRVCNELNTVGVDIFCTDQICTDRDVNFVNDVVKNARKKLVEIYPRKPKEDGYDIVKIRNNIHYVNETYIANVLKSEVGDKNNFVFYGIEYGHTHKVVVMDKEDVFPLKKIRFEDDEYPCPNNPEKILNILYGDFMAFPRDYDLLKMIKKNNAE